MYDVLYYPWYDEARKQKYSSTNQMFTKPHILASPSPKRVFQEAIDGMDGSAKTK